MPLTIMLAAALAAAQPPSDGGPRPLPGDWIVSDDYPADAIRREAEGAVQVRLDVDREGRVSNCTILKSSGDESLDSTTCRLLTLRARFDRARGPGARTHTRTVRWTLPERDPYPYALARTSSTVEADATGIQRCSTTRDAEVETLEPGECPSLLPPALMAWLRAQPSHSAVTMTLALVPQPGPPPGADRPEWGRLVSRAVAEVTIAADGAIASCRETLREMPVPLPMLAFPPDMCDFEPGRGPRFEPAANGGERRLRIIVTVHLRRDGAVRI
jgi:TonB family protein